MCSRFRHIVMPHKHLLPKLHLKGNICPGCNSVMSLIQKYSKGSSVVMELKDIISGLRHGLNCFLQDSAGGFTSDTLSGSHDTSVPVRFLNC